MKKTKYHAAFRSRSKEDSIHCRRLLLEALETRNVLACPFEEGTFEFSRPMILDELEIPGYVEFSQFTAPTDPQYPLSISVSMRSETASVLKWPVGSPFSGTSSFLSLRNGESVRPVLNAKSLAEATAGSIKSLLDGSFQGPYGAVLMDGTIQLRATQSVPDGNNGRKTCSRTENVYVSRFVSAANPTEPILSFGLTHESQSPTIKLRTTSTTRGATLRSTSEMFTVQGRDVVYRPTPTKHLEIDNGTIEVIAQNTNATVGSIIASGTRYKTRSVRIDEQQLESTVQAVFPFLTADSTTQEIVTKVKQHFSSARIPINWVSENEDILLDFNPGMSDEYITTSFEVPETTTSEIKKTVANRTVNAIETSRHQMSEHVTSVLRANNDERLDPTINVGAIQFDLAATRAGDQSNVISALSKVTSHALGKSLGFLGLNVLKGNRSGSELMYDPMLTAYDGIIGGTFASIGSRSFLKLVTGLGRDDTDVFDSPPNWPPLIDFLQTDQAIEQIYQDQEEEIYHDIDRDTLGLKPKIKLEVDGIEFVTGSIDFGSHRVGAEPPSVRIAIKNDGDFLLRLKSISLPPGYRLAFDPILPTTIHSTIEGQQPDSYSFVVKMDTEVEGVKSGPLTLESNDRTRNPVSISLTGRVTDVKTKFLTVLTHGWDPRISSDPVSLPWTTTYKSIVSNYGRDSIAPGSHQVEANVWDSSSGWNNAATAIKEYLTSPLYYFFELPALIQYVETQMALARKNATLSAWTIKQVVLREVAKDDPVRVHLIGHSRGGAVSAIASRMLAATAKVEQLTVLDGYSTDWPGIWGILGDADLEKQAFADRKLNFRVELSLVPGFNAKAPERRSFDRNTVIEGYAPYAGALGLSNHINVSDLYFHSYLGSDDGVFPKENYLNDSPIGRWISGSEGSSGSGEGPSTLPGSEMASVTGFSDGDFESSWRGQRFVADILALDASTDSELANYQEYLRNESHQKVAGWLSSGQVLLVASGEGGAAELTATASTPASISQPVYVPSGANRIRFSLNDLSPTQAGTVRVSLDNDVLLEQTISPTNLEVTVPLANSTGNMVQIKIEILSNGPGVKRIEIDDIRMEIPLAIDSIESTPEYLGDGDTIQIKATSTIPFSEVGGKIRFFLEFNDIPGLQPDGDRFLGEIEASTGESDWVIDVQKAKFPFKGTYSILAYVESGTAVGPVRELSFWVENSDSPLTNKQNPFDVDRDEVVNQQDVLKIRDFINAFGEVKLRASMLPIEHAIDVNNDGFVTRIDIVSVIDEINRLSGNSLWQNTIDPLDVNVDNRITPSDALEVINYLESVRLRFLPHSSVASPPYLDVNGDKRVSPADALLVINRLNVRSRLGEGEGEGQTEIYWTFNIDTHSLQFPRAFFVGEDLLDIHFFEQERIRRMRGKLQ